MPALDQCEPQVIRALQKAGWVVTHQPLQIRVSRNEAVYADLRLIQPAVKQTIIIVEVKCFAGKRSLLDEFYHAVGQYIVYREMRWHEKAFLYRCISQYPERFMMNFSSEG